MAINKIRQIYLNSAQLFEPAKTTKSFKWVSRNELKTLQDDFRSSNPRDTSKDKKEEKERIQKLWIEHFDKWVTDNVGSALTGALDPETLYIVTLPEFFFSDLQYDPSKQDDKIENYSNPLYEKSFKWFIENSGLKSLSSKNVIILAGTVWWKKRDPDLIFNSLPVFYDGKCIFLWDKQLLSGIDGLYHPDDDKTGKEDKWFNDPKRAANKSNIESKNLFTPFRCEQANSLETVPCVKIISDNVPFFEVIIDGKTIKFGVDICLDFIEGVSKILSGHKSNYKPDIQVVIAAGATYEEDSGWHAEKYTLACDVYDEKMHCINGVYQYSTAAKPDYKDSNTRGTALFIESDKYPI